jgi:hypothetical protein
MAEFAYNNSIHFSTGYSPFFANTGYHRRWMMLEHLDISNNPTVHERCRSVHGTPLRNNKICRRISYLVFGITRA